jgi:hypothetical protein
LAILAYLECRSICFFALRNTLKIKHLGVDLRQRLRVDYTCYALSTELAGFAIVVPSNLHHARQAVLCQSRVDFDVAFIQDIIIKVHRFPHIIILLE